MLAVAESRELHYIDACSFVFEVWDVVLIGASNLRNAEIRDHDHRSEATLSRMPARCGILLRATALRGGPSPGLHGCAEGLRRGGLPTSDSSSAAGVSQFALRYQGTANSVT